MRHFSHLSEEAQERLFQVRPQEVTVYSPKEVLSQALGACLYMPSTRPALREDLRKQAAKGCTTLVVCLEDSISDEDLPLGEAHVKSLLAELAREASLGQVQVASPGEEASRRGEFCPAPTASQEPLLFVRVRTPEHLRTFTQDLTVQELNVLTGFALPKFGESLSQAKEFIEAMEDLNRRPLAHPLYGMPILESPSLAYVESRSSSLKALQELLSEHASLVLAVRIGATDLSSVFGVRRTSDTTVWDVPLLASILADMANIFTRAGSDFVLSGSVWEHYIARERLLKPTLRHTPFQEQDEAHLRTALVVEDLDGFIKEVLLDKANGLLGKTVIHPTHVNLVNALSMVTAEEWADAQAVLSLTGGGAVGSTTGTKMNEGKPHNTWALAVQKRAKAFGVLREEEDFVKVLHSLHLEEVGL